jgi:hypothetical protein
MQMVLLCILMASHFQPVVDTASPQVAHFIPSPAGTPSPANTQLTLRLTAGPLLKGYTNIIVKWEMFVNGASHQKGTLPLRIPVSLHPVLIHLPAHLPTGNEEAWLRLDYHSTGPSSSHSSPSSSGTKLNSAPIATEWLLLKPYSTDDFIPAAGELSFSDSNDVFTINSPKAFLQFDKESGLMLRFEADHHQLSNALTPELWDSAQPRLQLFSTSTGTQLVIVRAEYTIPEVSSLLHLSYSINAAGVMLVEQSLEPDTTRQANAPPPPHFGMTWLLPPGLDSITWYGLSPQDTTGAVPSIHSSYFPASQSSHLPAFNVRWCVFTDHEGRGIRISADSNFLNISIHAAAADTAMLHSGSLSTQVNISRSFPDYRVPYNAIKFSYKITPMLPPARRDHP